MILGREGPQQLAAVDLLENRADDALARANEALDEARAVEYSL